MALVAVIVWFWSQGKIAEMQGPKRLPHWENTLDFSHRLLEKPYLYLRARPRLNSLLLTFSSLGVDTFAVLIFVYALRDGGLNVLLALVGIFGLRQIAQVLVRLPSPAGMMWSKPRFPTLFVTYDVRDDFFFSGHTAISVYGALVICQKSGSPWVTALALAVMAYEIIYVLVVRVHWFIDVLTGILVSLFFYSLT